jgi:hypothetical protein
MDPGPRTQHFRRFWPYWPLFTVAAVASQIMHGINRSNPEATLRYVVRYASEIALV